MPLMPGADIAAFTAQALATINSLSPQPYLSVGHQIAPYLNYHIDSFIQWNEGTLQVPIAETPSSTYLSDPAGRPTADVVRTSAPFGRKVVLVRARRLNAAPVLPDPTPSDENMVLALADIHTQEPAITPDMKGRIFTAVAVYVYHLLQPVWLAQDGGLYPKSDADGYNRNRYVVGPSQFVTGLI